MGSRYIIWLSLVFLFSCRNEKLQFNTTINNRIESVKSELIQYSESYTDINDFYVIVLDKMDSVIIYLGYFSSLNSVGYNNPLAVYRYNNKNFYIFFPNSTFIKTDSSLKINKPQYLMHDYPVWRISIFDDQYISKKGVEEYFSMRYIPKGIIQPQYVPPKIDSTILDNNRKNN